MTVYSGTFSPTSADGSSFSIKDPLADAREKLRHAARLPFHAHQPQSWQSAFRQLIADSRSDIRRHIWSAELPDSPLNIAETQEPRLHNMVDQQREEHRVFAEKVDELVDEASRPGEVDIWKMIELGEAAILLEMALARHHNRLTQIVYETTFRDIGEAG